MLKGIITKKRLQAALNIVCVLLLVLPLYQVGGQFELGGPYIWKTKWILNSFDLAVFFIPFLILLIVFQKTRNIKTKRIINIILLIVSILFFCWASMLTSFPIQDLIPYYSVAFLFFLPPILFLLLFVKE